VLVEVKKKNSESNESLFRRFTKKVQSSGKLLRYKKGQFKESEPSRNKVKYDAVRRKKVRSQNDYLRKIGRLEEVQDKKFGQRTQKKR